MLEQMAKMGMGSVDKYKDIPTVARISQEAMFLANVSPFISLPQVISITAIP